MLKSLQWIVLIFGLAMGYRAIWMHVAAGDVLFQHPVVDAGYHREWALRILAGDLLGHGDYDVFKPPLYPYLLAAKCALWGPDVAATRWLQHILGAVACVLTALLGSRIAGVRVGRIAGVLAAFYAPYVFFESQLLTPAVGNLLSLTALFVLLKPETPITLPRCLIAGVLFGLCVGLRPEILLPAALVSLYVLARSSRPLWPRASSRGAVLAAGVILAVAPIAARNLRLTGEFIPVSANAGINFYTGNSETADGVTAVPVGLRWEQLISSVPQSVLERPGYASHYWFRRAWEEMRSDPERTLRLLAVKAGAFLNGREFRNNISYAFQQDHYWPLRPPFLQFVFIFPLAVCGVVALSRSGRVAVPLLWIVGFWIVGIVFFVTARYRIPAVPMLIILTAAGTWELWTVGSSRRAGPIVSRVAVIGAAVLVAWPGWIRPRTHGRALDYVNTANAHRAAGNAIAAETACRSALAVSDDPDARLLLGSLLAYRGENTEAVEHLEAAALVVPDSPHVLLALARAHLAEGNKDAARETLCRVTDAARRVNLHPQRSVWAQAHVMLADLEPMTSAQHWQDAWAIHAPSAAEACLLRRRDMVRVLETFSKHAADQPWNWYAQANYATALMAGGRTAEAIAPLRTAIDHAPGKAGLRLQYAHALAAVGHRMDAIRAIDELIKLRPPSPLRQQADALRARLTGSATLRHKRH